MIHGGIPTIYVTDFPRAFLFYTQSLGLAVRSRVEDKWAELDAGGGLVLGLHPTERRSAAQRKGGVELGLYPDRPIEQAVRELTARGVKFAGPVVQAGRGRKLAYFTDPDGNVLYLFRADQ